MAVAMHGTNIAAGWLALLIMLAWIGFACLLVFLICCGWCGWMRRRDERIRRRQRRARPGPLPPDVTRSFREPRRLPQSGVTAEQLEAWYAEPAREPRP